MNEVVENDLEFTKKMFNESLKVLRMKGRNKYDFILKGGNSLLEALFKLYETVWNQEKKPDSWRDTIILQIDKGKVGLKEDLNFKRHIHTKNEIQKVFSHILTNKMKPK